MQKVKVKNLFLAALLASLPVGFGLWFLAGSVSGLANAVESLDFESEPAKIEITPPVRFAEQPKAER